MSKLKPVLTEEEDIEAIVKKPVQQSASAFESQCNIVLSEMRNKESQDLLNDKRKSKQHRSARDSKSTARVFHEKHSRAKSTPLLSKAVMVSSEGMERPSEATMAPRLEPDTTHGNVEDLWNNIDEAKDARDTAKTNFEKAYLAYYKKEVDYEVLEKSEKTLRALQGDTYERYLKYKGMVATVKRLNRQFAKATLQKAEKKAEKSARKSNKINRFLGGSYNNIEHQIKILSPSLKLKKQYLKYKNKYLKLKQKLESKYTDIKYTIRY